ncbi:deoxyribodipyrimidine photolyase [Paenibacillus swuensis]|uniref:Deoxyribodipyrimidine photolyase n=1 Tax=Paenibacillus swuensis TaxID=1178515 RepID=A0A172TFT1_9BACL|nr:deoxyribodipyrimidine photo-lyase [Paenibacillus swuensis]ANE45925.1 deoxyribodipyrimidine photolyase [Paenibacillus swuensis]
MYLFMHRKDLRIEDLRAFDRLRDQGQPGIHLLILDPVLLDEERANDHSGRTFLRAAGQLIKQYEQADRHLNLLYGNPAEVLAAVLRAHPVTEVVFHEDYTPYARRRDGALAEAAAAHAVPVYAVPNATLADIESFQQYSGKKDPYKVFTPFYRKMKTYLELFYSPASAVSLKDLDTVRLNEEVLRPYAVPPEVQALLERAAPSAEEPSAESVLTTFLEERLEDYDAKRDDYRGDFTSGISSLLNTGALSIRRVYERLLDCEHRDPWLRQLIWREFYLYQAQLDPFFFRYEEQYDMRELSDVHLKAWRSGTTGIPIIDAAMRELNATGRMPNRLRMVTAMFLTKNLLCPFPLGEQYFRRKLADYDHILNRGGWLWSSSIGFDAAPYFRIMNPVSQSVKFDPRGEYIRRWLPELAHLSDKEIHQPRPEAIVDLKLSRAVAIDRYRSLLATRVNLADADMVD